MRLFGLVSAADRSRSSWPGHYFVTQFKHQMNPLSRELSGDLCNFFAISSVWSLLNRPGVHRPPNGYQYYWLCFLCVPETIWKDAPS